MAIISLKTGKQKTNALARRQQAELERAPQNDVKQIVADTKLEVLLKGHGVQASQLANLAAQRETVLLSADPDNGYEQILLAAQRLEHVRRSAVSDLAMVAKVLDELRHPPVVVAAVSDRQAYYASGSTKVFGGRQRGAEDE